MGHTAKPVDIRQLGGAIRARGTDDLLAPAAG
jgi:hypothetical protein